jgi:hypothetical protein
MYVGYVYMYVEGTLPILELYIGMYVHVYFHMYNLTFLLSALYYCVYLCYLVLVHPSTRITGAKVYTNFHNSNKLLYITAYVLNSKI